MSTVSCPFCNNQLLKRDRYPNYVCFDCHDKTVTEKGVKIEFYNVDHSGGFVSVINGVKGEEHICFIDGNKCWADEDRFGGIVIRLMQENN